MSTSSSQISSSSGGLTSLLPSISVPDSISNATSKLISNPPSATTLLALGTAAVAGYCALEQLRFSWWRRGKDGKVLPGPSKVTPLLGGIVEMVKDPYGFWERQRKWSFPGMSWHSLVGTFTVFVTDAAISRHVFNHNSEDTLLLALHPSAKTVLGANNIAFLHGPGHKQLRKSFIALFTRKALSVYVAKQDAIICEQIRNWLDEQGGSDKELSQPFEIRNLVQRLNATTSQEVFAGPYLGDAENRAKFLEAYRNMTDAFLGFPLFVPGTAAWRGIQARKFIVKVLTKAAAESKARMATGAEPDCLLDFWSQQVLQEIKEAEEQGVPPPFYSADGKMAEVVMDFLFASQDASTASLVQTVTLMAEHPDVLEKVRAEQKQLRPDPSAPITGEVLGKMQYTKQVVKEILRYRPPAPMVPQTVQQPFKLTEDYTAPKGSMVIPSVWAACMQGYENPTAFDPDRFGPERREDVKYASNYLVFGHGPHYCVGKEYANNHLAAFLSRIATSLEWTRIRSEVSDNTIYLPTLYPGDSVFRFKWAYPGAREAGVPLSKVTLSANGNGIANGKH